MIVKVIREFIDIHTNALHKVGTELEITEERMNEILSVGDFVEPVDPEVTQETEITEEAPKKRKKG